MARRPRDIWLLAGWLFADLALALFVISLGAMDDANLQARTARASTSSATTVSASPSPTPGAPKGLRPTPLTVTVPTVPGAGSGSDEDRSRTLEQLRIRFAGKLHTQDRAALVETFGASDVPGDGVKRAKFGNQLLLAAFPSLLPPKTPMTNYWDGSSGMPRGSLIFKVWLFQA